MYLYFEMIPKKNQVVDFLETKQYTRVGINYVKFKNKEFLFKKYSFSLPTHRSRVQIMPGLLFS